MAQKKQIALRKQEIIAQLAESREAIDHGRTAIKEKLNVKNQVSSLLKRKPKAVFAGSAVAGLAATLLLRSKRKKKVKAKKPLNALLLGWTIKALKPSVKKWLTKSVKTYLIGKVSSVSRRKPAQLADTRSEVVS